VTKEELPSVAGSDGLISTIGGDAKNLSFRIRHHVDLVPARLIGDVSDVATVWRKRWSVLIEFRGQNRDRLFANWQHPEIKTCDGMSFYVGEEPPVRRPRFRVSVVLADGEGFRIAAARCRNLVEVPASGAIGREGDPAAIRVPDSSPCTTTPERGGADENVDRSPTNVANPDRPAVVGKQDLLAVR